MKAGRLALAYLLAGALAAMSSTLAVGCAIGSGPPSNDAAATRPSPAFTGQTE
jgi:hypothetical protein